MYNPKINRRQLLTAVLGGGVALGAGASSSGWVQLLANEVARAAKPRQCVLLWMSGGPSQIDTFDMKPGHSHGGEFREVAFQLQPDDQIIPAGQQIGLVIFSSDREFTLWPEPGTELTIDLSGCELTLPIVGGLDTLNQALETK